jgi:D-alanyl-D-alanine dipeptidase
MNRHFLRFPFCRAGFGLLLAMAAAIGPGAARGAEDDWRALVASGQLVEVTKVDPSIRVELRYAVARNGVGTALYPPDFPCLIRPEVAVRLRLAQEWLRKQGRGLKIWDAYRPLAAQRELRKKFADSRFVANPAKGRGSLHCMGLAVDVTLVDAAGQDVPMPTDFDVFSEAASSLYKGEDAAVKENLRLLHYAMMRVGRFQGLSFEWWHFTARDWKDFKPLGESKDLRVAPNAPDRPDGAIMSDKTLPAR